MCVDFLVDLGDIEPEFGQKEKLVKGYTLELGGSTSIFASQAAKLGLRSAGIGKVGDDVFGTIILEALSKTGVISDHIHKDPNIKTGVGVALCKKDDRAILTYMGSIDALEKKDFDYSIIENTRHIHIGSYYLMKGLQPHYIDILQHAKQNGVTISLDTNWDPDERWESGIWDILPYVDIFLPNANEAMGITKMKTPADAFKMLADNVRIVAVKKGHEGSSAFHNGNEYVAAPLQITVADAVGAGDNFDAGFVYGFLSGKDITTCLKMGNICGALSATKHGGIAGQPQKHLLLEYL